MGSVPCQTAVGIDLQRVAARANPSNFTIHIHILHALHSGRPAAYVDPQNECAAQIAYLLPVKKLQIAAVAANLYLGAGVDLNRDGDRAEKRLGRNTKKTLSQLEGAYRRAHLLMLSAVKI